MLATLFILCIVGIIRKKEVCAMPEASGLEVARYLQHDHPCARVIMLSMHRTPEHIIQALEAGARGYVLKESASDEVIGAIRAVQAGGGI